MDFPVIATVFILGIGVGSMAARARFAQEITEGKKRLALRQKRQAKRKIVSIGG